MRILPIKETCSLRVPGWSDQGSRQLFGPLLDSSNLHIRVMSPAILFDWASRGCSVQPASGFHCEFFQRPHSITNQLGQQPTPLRRWLLV